MRMKKIRYITHPFDCRSPLVLWTDHVKHLSVDPLMTNCSMDEGRNMAHGYLRIKNYLARNF